MSPYLSVVMGIGGLIEENLIRRLNISTWTNMRLAEKHGLDAEWVIVEWNMPAGLKLTEKVQFPALRPIRIIHTPQELHTEMRNPYGFRFFEWYPKNIGIRRSHGQFVLSTNPDDVWSDELAKFLASKALERSKFYRVNRHDMIEGRVFRICHATGPHSPNATEEEIRNVVAPKAAPWSEEMLHYSASGDFTLMSRLDWFRIHGNPEREYNDSVDGQTLYLAHLKGMKQVVLPHPLFHPDHVRTLNFSETSRQVHAGFWDDRKPFTRQNGEEWGFGDKEFEETTINV